MRKSYLTVMAIALGSCISPILAQSSLSAAHHDTEEHKSVPQIRVQFLLEKKTILMGSPLLMRVEIKNIGNDTIFVPSSIQLNGSGAPGKLSVSIFDPKDDGFASSTVFFTCRFSPMEGEFHNLVYENWVELPPGKTYIKTFDLTYATYDIAKTPGRYHIRAELSAFGMSSDNFNNPLDAHLKEVTSLPFLSWEGRVTSKTIRIEITPAKLIQPTPNL